MNKTLSIILTGTLMTLTGTSLFAQARWTASSGNWIDTANWSGGSGPGGLPGAGQTVTLPGTAGDILLDTDQVAVVGQLGALSQQGGVLSIGPDGGVSFSGNVRVAEGVGTTGVLVVNGRLEVAGGLDVGFGDGAAGGGSEGELHIASPAFVRINGNLDTWWDPDAILTISGSTADIEVGATFWIGPTATIGVNIDSEQFSTLRAQTQVGVQGGTLNVDFINGYVPDLGDSWAIFDAGDIAGEIPNVNLPSVGPGKTLTLAYEPGGLGEVLSLNLETTLNLQVDANTGGVSIQNPVAGADSINIDGYIIRSESGSLVEADFMGLGEAGWLPGLDPSQSDTLLSESNLNSSTVISSGDDYFIGNIFNIGGSQDLDFEFHVAGGSTLDGTVLFITDGVLACDFDGDGECDTIDIDLLGKEIIAGTNDPSFDINGDEVVDLADQDQWRADAATENGFDEPYLNGDANLDGSVLVGDLNAVGTNWLGSPDPWSSGDFNADGIVGVADLNLLALNWQGSIVAAASPAVPEPAGITMVVVGLIAILQATRRHR